MIFSFKIMFKHEHCNFPRVSSHQKFLCICFLCQSKHAHVTYQNGYFLFQRTPSLGWWVHEQHKNINMFNKNKQKSKLTQKQFSSLLVLDFLGTMQKCENKNVHCELFSVENQYVHENTDSDAIVSFDTCCHWPRYGTTYHIAILG